MKKYWPFIKRHFPSILWGLCGIMVLTIPISCPSWIVGLFIIIIAGQEILIQEQSDLNSEAIKQCDDLLEMAKKAIEERNELIGRK